MKDLELFAELITYTVLVASPFVGMVFFGMVSYQETAAMTYKECLAVVAESMIVGICLGIPMVFLLEIILKIS